MRTLQWKHLGLVALIAMTAGCGTREVSYKSDIRPILDERCMSCHAPGAPGCKASGFSVANYKSLMKGTRYGAMIVPGSSIQSNLIRLIKHEADPSIAMPRSHTPGQPSEWLSGDEIKTVETWVDQGAKEN